MWWSECWSCPSGGNTSQEEEASKEIRAYESTSQDGYESIEGDQRSKVMEPRQSSLGFIDEDDMSKLENERPGASMVVPKLKDDKEIAANYGIPLKSLQDLKQLIPECPAAELARFLAKRSVSGDVKKGAEKVHEYLAWLRDEVPKFPLSPPGFLPPFRFNGMAKDGSRLLLLIPCVLDPDVEPESYSHDLARSMIKELDRADTMRITVLADTRGHEALGYEGKPIWKLWWHVKALAWTFQSFFPERLQRFVIYPAGDVEMAAFRFAKALFSRETMKRVSAVHKKEGSFALAPPREILQYFELTEILKENQMFFAGLDDSVQ